MVCHLTCGGGASLGGAPRVAAKGEHAAVRRRLAHLEHAAPRLRAVNRCPHLRGLARAGCLAPTQAHACVTRAVLLTAGGHLDVRPRPVPSAGAAHHLCVALEGAALVDREEEHHALAALGATEGASEAQLPRKRRAVCKGASGASVKQRSHRARTEYAWLSFCSLRCCVAQMPFFNEIRTSRIEKLFTTK